MDLFLFFSPLYLGKLPRWSIFLVLICVHEIYVHLNLCTKGPDISFYPSGYHHWSAEAPGYSGLGSSLNQIWRNCYQRCKYQKIPKRTMRIFIWKVKESDFRDAFYFFNVSECAFISNLGRICGRTLAGFGSVLNFSAGRGFVPITQCKLKQEFR